MFLLKKIFFILSDCVCLGCEELSESHTGENIADVLQVILMEYNFKFDKGISISAATTDSGANIIKAINNLMVPHVPCFGHSFNTSVQKVFSLQEIKPIIEKVKKIQNIFAYSWMAAKELSIEQERYGFKLTKFPSFSKTRWWSMLDVLDVVISQELPLSSFLRTHKKGVHKEKILTEDEMKIIKNILLVLKPIRVISDNLSAESYVTASAILPVIKMLENKMQYQELQTDNDMSHDNYFDPLLKNLFFKTIIDVLHTRYNNSIILQFCTALDPRFKLEQFNFDNAEETLFKDTLQVECLQNWKYWQSKSDSPSSSSSTMVHQNKKTKGLSLSAIFNSEFGSETVNMVRIF